MSSVFSVLKTVGKPLPSLIPLYFFLAMFCVALGFDFNIFTVSVYDQKRLIQVSTFVLLGITLLFDRRLLIDIHQAWSYLPTISRRVLLLVAVLGALSSYLAPLPKPAFQEWSLFGLLFMFTLYVSTQLSSLSVQKVVLAMLAIAVSLYSWRFLAGAYLPSLGLIGGIKGYDVFVGFAHPRFLNQIQTWVLPLFPALLVVFSGVPRRYYWLLWVPGILGWTLLYASSGRATLIAMICSAIVVLVLFTRKSFAWLKVHSLFAIVGLALYLLLFHAIPHMLSVGMNLPKVTERLAQDGLMGRESLWRLAWEITRENPLLGLGPQQYANYHYHAIAAHPHSAYFQWVSEWGLVSFALICGLLVYGFTKWVKFCRHTLHKDNGEESIILISLTASLVAGATHALVSGIIVMPFSQMLMCLVIGWVLAIYFSAGISNSSHSGAINFQRIGVLTIALIFIGTISYTSYPALTQTDQLREAYLTQYPREKILKPRFWNQGLIGWQKVQQ